MENLRITSYCVGNVVRFAAISDLQGKSKVIGYVQGVVQPDGVALLGDIFVEPEIRHAGGFLGLRMISVSLRSKGMGSDLLGRFESELANRGIVQIYGHLPNESPEVIDCLTRWYQKRGYQVNVNPKPGEVPNGSKGKISKTIHPSTS